MKLKDKEVSLMMVTLVKGLQELNEVPDIVKTIYFKMITLLFDHFFYSIKDLKRIEEFTEEEKSFIDLPVLGSFIDPDSLSDEDHFKEILTEARVMSTEQELQEDNDNQLN